MPLPLSLPLTLSFEGGDDDKAYAECFAKDRPPFCLDAGFFCVLGVRFFSVSSCSLSEASEEERIIAGDFPTIPLLGIFLGSLLVPLLLLLIFLSRPLCSLSKPSRGSPALFHFSFLGRHCWCWLRVLPPLLSSAMVGVGVATPGRAPRLTRSLPLQLPPPLSSYTPMFDIISDQYLSPNGLCSLCNGTIFSVCSSALSLFRRIECITQHLD